MLCSFFSLYRYLIEILLLHKHKNISTTCVLCSFICINFVFGIIFSLINLVLHLHAVIRFVRYRIAMTRLEWNLFKINEVLFPVWASRYDCAPDGGKAYYMSRREQCKGSGLIRSVSDHLSSPLYSHSRRPVSIFHALRCIAKTSSDRSIKLFDKRYGV